MLLELSRYVEHSVQPREAHSLLVVDTSVHAMPFWSLRSTRNCMIQFNPGRNHLWKWIGINPDQIRIGWIRIQCGRTQTRFDPVQCALGVQCGCAFRHHQCDGQLLVHFRSSVTPVSLLMFVYLVGVAGPRRQMLPRCQMLHVGVSGGVVSQPQHNSSALMLSLMLQYDLSVQHSLLTELNVH